MFKKKIASMLLASSILVTLQAAPVFAGTSDKAAGTDLSKYETEADSESEDSVVTGLYKSVEEWIGEEEAKLEEEAELEEGRRAADAAADAAEKAADEAMNRAEETEGQDIEDAAESASEDAENARAAADLAGGAIDETTIDMALSIAQAAQEKAEEAAKEAVEKAEEEAEAARAAAEAEAAAREAEMLASAEYLGNFTLTAYCNCARCCGSAGNATASGVMPTSGHTVAMGGIDFGTKLLINGTVYTVEDRGTPYGHVDIFMDSHEEALQFGMSSADVYLVKE